MGEPFRQLFRWYVNIYFALRMIPLHWQWSMLRPGPLSRRGTFLVGLWYRRVARRHRKARSKVPAVLLDPVTWESMSNEEFLAIWDNPSERAILEQGSLDRQMHLRFLLHFRLKFAAQCCTRYCTIRTDSARPTAEKGPSAERNRLFLLGTTRISQISRPVPSTTRPTLRNPDSWKLSGVGNLQSL